MEPKACPGFIYRCSISLGRINMSPTEFRTFIENVAAEYHGDTYHLISKNCNHFTDDIACRLTERRIPGWVNRLARLGKENLYYGLLVLDLFMRWMCYLENMFDYCSVLVVQNNGLKSKAFSNTSLLERNSPIFGVLNDI